MGTGCRYRTRREQVAGREAVILSHDGGGRPERAMEAWVAPDFGANLCRFSVGGKSVIDFDPRTLAEQGYTGTPVLYPTPNRVRNGVFRWQGRAYRQLKAGALVLEHGLVHGEAWQRGQPEVEGEAAGLQTRLEFRPGSAVFEAFPFPHRLGLDFRLSERGLTVTYTIHNQGEAELPFGFGLHPYFQKLAGEEDLDHVFTGIAAGEHARIEYRGLGLTVGLEASPDFSHLVLYTPRAESCSTDAHNLFDRGFRSESGLKTVKPGETHRGFVTYAVSY